jgi:peptide/nickel transport system permease protein
MVERCAAVVLLVLLGLGALAAIGLIGQDWASLPHAPGLPPGSTAWLGSNALGQDLGARWLQALASLWKSVLPAATGALLLSAALAWLAAGRGATGALARGGIDLSDALPALLVALALLLIWRGGPLGVVLALLWCLWPYSVRLLEAEFTRLRTSPLWASATLVGATPLDAWRTHALPLLRPLLRDQFIVLALLGVNLEVALGFIGVYNATGVSLGSLLAEAQSALSAGSWWPLVLPAFTLLLLAGGMIALAPRRFLSASRVE